MQLCFEQLAGSHVRFLKISGKCVRMNSKLIGSNIARQSRYELIHTTLVKFLKTCTLTSLSPEQEERAKGFFEDKDIKAYQLRKQKENIALEEQHKRNNVEAAMF